MTFHEVPSPAIAQAAERWGLVLLEKTNATYSETWFAMRGDDHVVIKHGSERTRLREARCLLAYESGATTEPPVACRLLESAPGLVLVERVLMGDDLRPLAASDDDAATAIAGGVYRRMHEAVAHLSEPPPGVAPLADIAEAFDTYWVARRAGNPHTLRLDDALVARAQNLLAEIAAPEPTDILLHGDAHHQNILRWGWGEDDDEWRVIDPHGWWGDATFDAATLMLNLHGSLELEARSMSDLRAMAQRRAAILEQTAGMDRQRLLAWTLVGGVVAELWCLEDHGFVQGGPARLAAAVSEIHLG